MTISSRTPEGQPGCCPVCQARVVIEPSVLTGDAPCPACGHLLWFVQTAEQTHCFEAESSTAKRQRVFDLIAQQLGVVPERLINSPEMLRDIEADSLDMVELSMELEEELAGNWTDEPDGV
ncbi:phosphopantetheine-binding protein [Bremerella cremea]|nr:phosphopantetheine-binding protein [Bremerella cremea]